MIYFIAAPDLNMVKIGYSAKPHARFVKVRSDCPVRVVLKRTMDGDTAVERDLHSRFSDARVRGEWFHITTTVAAFMDGLDEPAIQPVSIKRNNWNHRECLVNEGVSALYQDVKSFSLAHGFSPRRFGHECVNDAKFISGIVTGRRVWPETEQRVRDFMAAYRLHPTERAA